MLPFKHAFRILSCGVLLLSLNIGCGSRLETSIISESVPPKPSAVEATQPEAREPVMSPEPVTEEEMVATAEAPTGIPRIDIPVEPPTRPFLREEPARTVTPTEEAQAAATPQEELIEPEHAPAPQMEASTPPQAVPPMAIEPIPPTQPYLRPEAPSSAPASQPEIAQAPSAATIEPELPSPVAPSEAPPLSPPTPGRELAQAVPPAEIEPESPTYPFFREEAPLPAAPVEEAPIAPPMPRQELAQALPPAAIEPESPARPSLPTEEAPFPAPSREAKIPPTSEGQKAVPPTSHEPMVAEEEIPEAPTPIRDVFFDYDKALIRDDAVPVLTENAELLLNHYSDGSIIIEGHCDERGTQAYNLVLGKRRAQAVKEYLVDLGVPAERLEIVSFGKEKPFCTAHSLSCWQQNRRAHFVLR